MGFFPPWPVCRVKFIHCVILLCVTGNNTWEWVSSPPHVRLFFLHVAGIPIALSDAVPSDDGYAWILTSRFVNCLTLSFGVTHFLKSVICVREYFLFLSFLSSLLLSSNFFSRRHERFPSFYFILIGLLMVAKLYRLGESRWQVPLG